MKYAVIFCLAFVFAYSLVNAGPIEADVNGEVILRSRRATCDLLSIDTKFGSLNHAACATHCLFKKYKGGRCRDGVCHCRN